MGGRSSNQDDDDGDFYSVALAFRQVVTSVHDQGEWGVVVAEAVVIVGGSTQCTVLQ